MTIYMDYIIYFNSCYSLTRSTQPMNLTMVQPVATAQMTRGIETIMGLEKDLKKQALRPSCIRWGEIFLARKKLWHYTRRENHKFKHTILSGYIVVSNMFYFHPYLGKIPNFDEHILQRGWFNHQPVMKMTNHFKGQCFLKIPVSGPK